MPPAMLRRFQGCQCAVKPLDLLKAAGGTPTLSGRIDASAACHFEKMNALIANPVLWVCYDWLCRYF